MCDHGGRERSSLLAAVVVLILAMSMGACATPGGRDAPDIRIVGLEALPSEGLELRFALKMRVSNPNDSPVGFDGIAVKLDLDGRGVASGVSDARGEVPRFGEELVTVPVSISAFGTLRQLLGRLGDGGTEAGEITRPIAYSLSGKLGGVAGSRRSTRFADKGELDLFPSAKVDP